MEQFGVLPLAFGEGLEGGEGLAAEFFEGVESVVDGMSWGSPLWVVRRGQESIRVTSMRRFWTSVMRTRWVSARIP